MRTADLMKTEPRCDDEMMGKERKKKTQFLGPKRPHAREVEAAMTRRKEYLCWGLLAFAKHAGQASLRGHEAEADMQLDKEGRLDNDVDEVHLGHYPHPHVAGKDVHPVSRPYPDEIEGVLLKHQLVLLQEQMAAQWRAKADILTASIHLQQRRQQDLQHMLHHALGGTPEPPLQQPGGLRRREGKSCTLFHLDPSRSLTRALQEGFEYTTNCVNLMYKSSLKYEIPIKVSRALLGTLSLSIILLFIRTTPRISPIKPYWSRSSLGLDDP